MSNITLLQALLCGIIYWLSIGNLPFVGLWTLQKPLVCGTLVGLILGDPVQGALVGASINLMYIGFVSAGGSMPADISLAGIIGTAYAISSGVDAKTALTLSVPMGILGLFIWNARMTFDSFFVHMADSYIEKEEYHKIWRANVLYPQIFCALITILPCMLSVYYGGRYLSSFINLIDGKVLSILQLIGGLMPCMGIAITLTYIFHGDYRLYFFIGFLMESYGKFPMHMMGVISILVAGVYIQLKDYKYENVMDEEEEDEEEEVYEITRVIPKHALVKSWLIWETFPQTCYNYERMMGQHMAHMFVPLLKYFYKEEPDKKKAMMKREATFYNTHVEIGACVSGMSIALEEQKALTGKISDQLIKNLKTSFMGSLAGIGDTLWQGIFIPVVLVSCIDITNMGDGNVWGTLIYVCIVLVSAYTLSYLNFMFGYRLGGEAIVTFLENRKMKKLMSAASIMGCMVMGALLVKYVNFSCGIVLENYGKTFELQTELFDKVCPNILPLAMTMLVYYLMHRRGWSSRKIIALCVIIGILCGYTAILTV